MKKIIVGVTGASGSVFAHRLVESLLELGHEVHLLATPNGQRVCAYELEKNFEELSQKYRSLSDKLYIYNNEDLFSRISSGSYKTDAMVIVPCSMGTLAKIAQGISSTLITRAADVMIKEHRKLILITRESPLSSIHLKNMLELSNLGVVIMPPVPAFYHKPKTLEESIDLTVGRILESLDIENPYHKVWEDPNGL
jgi:4-hydroxy-3-polyprenylbenzoate decarboxylase